MKEEKNMIEIKDKRIAKRIAIGDFFERYYFEIFATTIAAILLIGIIVISISGIEKCPDCNKLHTKSKSNNYRYCTECGHDFFNMCSCGERNDPKAKYCQKCGNQLSSEE